ncbi:hypothetical protein LCGC14_2918920 [marine sediment metagenome]|uniref:Uncharacterized protein n=1 Tax=marine sediment metagenome TaxID=412755 RepID=A0A0F8XPJ6_9ZZZZ
MSVHDIEKEAMLGDRWAVLQVVSMLRKYRAEADEATIRDIEDDFYQPSTAEYYEEKDLRERSDTDPETP